MSTAKFDTLSNLAGTRSIATDRVAQGTAAAWVNFNGTGTVAIRASFNVSSITDNGTGQYTVNFTTAMPDANYSLVYGGGITTATSESMRTSGSLSSTATSQIQTLNIAQSAYKDFDNVYVAIFR